jgi:carbon starvation protein CstA
MIETKGGRLMAGGMLMGSFVAIMAMIGASIIIPASAA